jgi:hypothetical protein
VAKKSDDMSSASTKSVTRLCAGFLGVVLISGCCIVKSGEPFRKQARPKVSIQSAVALGVGALNRHMDMEEWAGRYKLAIERHDDHWDLYFVYLPEFAGGETWVQVYDTREVVVLPGY